MKTQTLNKKSSKIRHANGRHVRFDGKRFLIRVATLGPSTLASAEEIGKPNPPVIDLFAKTTEAKEIRGLVEQGCFS
jgi:hypothetical protein